MPMATRTDGTQSQVLAGATASTTAFADRSRRAHDDVSLCVEVSATLEIRDEAGVGWAPSEALLRQLARARRVHCEHLADEAQHAHDFLGGLRDRGHVQALADDLRNVANRNAFVGDSVVSAARGALLER